MNRMAEIVRPKGFNPPPPAPPGEDSLNIAIISDLHLGWDGPQALGHLPAFLADWEAGPAADLLVLNGDVNGLGLESYPLVESELLARLSGRVVYLSGNVEARTDETLARYYEISARPLDSVVWLRGVRLVFLGVCVYDHEIPIEPARLNWLEAELDEHRATTLIFHHVPLADTVYNSGDHDRLFPTYYPFNTRVPNSKPIKQLLARHPEVLLWMSGHNHAKHRGVDRLGYSAIRREGACLHVAVANLGYKDSSAEGRCVYVEPNRLLVRTRNFQRREWVDDLAFEYPVTTTLTRSAGPGR